MLRADPAVVPGGTGAVCVVSGGLGASPGGEDWAREAADALVRGGDRVCRLRVDTATGGLTLDGTAVRAAAGPWDVPNVHGSGQPADVSDRVRQALANLVRERGISRVVFGTRGGLGFRSIQARRTGLAFSDVPVTVVLEATTAWARDREGARLYRAEELELDYMERFAFERADEGLIASAEAARFVESRGWRVGEARPGAGRSGVNRPSPRPPLVSVCVAHFNLGPYLPETLASLAAQTYRPLEVIVIDDGSTDLASRAVFEEMKGRYPKFEFRAQENAGIGATRNRGLALARGKYFLPVDADNVLRPDMIETLVGALERRPEAAVASCYFLAFATSTDLERGRYLYAYRPVGGPQVLASCRNVYGDACSLHRVEAFRSVGGYGTERDSSFEDWEAFVKLVQAGQEVEVVPEPLFYYRRLDGGFSRSTSGYRNHRRVIRQLARQAVLPLEERMLLWDAVVGMQQQLAEVEARQGAWRYRAADLVHRTCRRVPGLARGVKALLAGW